MVITIVFCSQNWVYILQFWLHNSQLIVCILQFWKKSKNCEIPKKMYSMAETGFHAHQYYFKTTELFALSDSCMCVCVICSGRLGRSVSVRVWWCEFPVRDHQLGRRMWTLRKTGRLHPRAQIFRLDQQRHQQIQKNISEKNKNKHLYRESMPKIKQLWLYY